MHIGRTPACSQCGAMLCPRWTTREPISGLDITEAECIRCGAGFLYAEKPAGYTRPVDEDD